MEDVEAAHIKGRMEPLFSLAEYNIISLNTAATLSGLSKKGFQKQSSRLEGWTENGMVFVLERG